MKECEAIAIELPGFVGGKLESGDVMLVRSHLQSCDACQIEVQRLERLEELLTNYLPAIEPSPTFASTFANRLAAEVMAESEREAAAEHGGFLDWLFRPWVIPVAVAAVLGGLLVIPLLKQGPGETSVVPRVAGPPAVASSAKKPSADGKAAPDSKLAANNAPKGVIASAPPPEVIERPELFVDYAVIRDLDALEADNNLGSDKTG